MTIPEEAAVLLDAFEMGYINESAVIRWADETIIRSEPTPEWLIELSTMPPTHPTDMMALLRKNAAFPPPMRRHIQIVVLLHRQCGLPFADTVSRLFQVAILERNGSATSYVDDSLMDMLVEWDCQDFPVVEPPLQERLERLFQEYLADAADVARVMFGNPRDQEKGRL
jgi:hypothetical protein